MRITDGILKDTSLRSGISLSGGTLVNQLNGDSTDSLIGSLHDQDTSAPDSVSREKYKKLRESAEKLEAQANRLKKTGEDSVFEKAKESGDTSEVCGEISSLVSSYNELMEKLRSDTSTMGMFYWQSLQEAVTENKDALSEIGITVDKNGKMRVDEEKLKSADLDKIEKLMGAEGTVMAKLSLISGKIVDNAEANLKSVSSQYNAAGNSVDALLRSFDSKG